MNDKLTTASVQEFLKDYLQYSETTILEEGAEKDDILAVAQARGYELKDNHDLAGFKTVFTFADIANKNRARLPKEKLLKALPGMIGKPVDIDHIRNYVVGHYIDYRYVVAEEKVIAYGVFYKSNFGDEWKKAKALFKAGKLSTSYEAWCPKSKYKHLADGTYELTEITIAGGGLMFKETPAFEDAKVLELAKKRIDECAEDLVMASVQNKPEDLIISSTAVVEAPAKAEVQKPVVEVPVVPVVDVKVAEKPVVQVAAPAAEVAKPVVAQVPVVPVTVPKVKCQNCQQEFDNTGMVATQSEKKCPHCKAIVGEQGEVKYPPQIIEFALNCPSCRSSNWLLKSSDENQTHVKCQSCKKEYNVAFDNHMPNELIGKISFVRLGSANCLQCGTYIPFSTTSQNKQKSLTCPSCGLHFTADISKMDSKRKIAKIEEIAELNKASAEGGSKEMDQTNEQNQNPADVQVPVVPVAAVTEAQTVEQPVAAAPAQEAPAAEKPADAPVETVVAKPAEEVPAVEAVPAEPVKASVEEQEVEDAEAIEVSEFENLEVAKVMTTDQRNALPDSDFAVVKVVKNKKTGDNRKIRMYPLNDEAHVRNALARVNQDAGKKGLEALGISVEDVKKKIEAKAKSIGIEVADVQPPVAKPAMTQEEIDQMEMELCDAKKKNKKLKALFKAACKRAKSLKAASKLEKASLDEMAVVKTENSALKEKIQVLETSAVKIIERKNALGEYGKDLSDKDILDDDKFEVARVKKENVELKSKLVTASAQVSVKTEAKRSDDELARIAKEIDLKRVPKK
jgi:transposase-like protein